MKTRNLFKARMAIAAIIICIPFIRAQTGDGLISAVTYQDLSRVIELMTVQPHPVG